MANTINDPDYQHDLTDAGRRAEHMRHTGDLGRVLWLLNEKASWQLALTAEGLRRLAAIQEAIAALPPEPVIDLGPTNALLQTLIAFIMGVDQEPGQASTLGLSFGTPEPQPASE